jgi:hypothetical protein
LYNPQLETFITVAESRSFAKAADINHPHSIKKQRRNTPPGTASLQPFRTEGLFFIRF